MSAKRQSRQWLGRPGGGAPAGGAAPPSCCIIAAMSGIPPPLLIRQCFESLICSESARKGSERNTAVDARGKAVGGRGEAVGARGGTAVNAQGKAVEGTRKGRGSASPWSGLLLHGGDTLLHRRHVWHPARPALLHLLHCVLHHARGGVRRWKAVATRTQRQWQHTRKGSGNTHTRKSSGNTHTRKSSGNTHRKAVAKHTHGKGSGNTHTRRSCCWRLPASFPGSAASCSSPSSPSPARPHAGPSSAGPAMARNTVRSQLQ